MPASLQACKVEIVRIDIGWLSCLNELFCTCKLQAISPIDRGGGGGGGQNGCMHPKQVGSDPICFYAFKNCAPPPPRQEVITFFGGGGGGGGLASTEVNYVQGQCPTPLLIIVRVPPQTPRKKKSWMCPRNLAASLDFTVWED